MATKTKETRFVDHAPEVQEVLREALSLCSGAIYELGFGTPKAAADYIRTATATLSRAASNLRRLLEAQEHGSSPRTGPGSAPAKRKDVAGGLPKRPSVDSRPSKARARKRVARKPSLKEFFDNINLPH